MADNVEEVYGTNAILNYYTQMKLNKRKAEYWIASPRKVK